MPKLKLKNACPIACNTVSEVTLEKSGANKNVIALLKSPLIIEYITINIIKKPSMGINIFTILPIPSFTPAATIKAVRTIKMVCQKSKLIGEEITLLNSSDALMTPDEDAAITT